MEEKRFPYRVASITLSTAILVISCILAIPLFPNQRSSNLIGGCFGTLIYLGSCALLIFELWKTDILPRFLETLKAKIVPCMEVERNNPLINHEIIRPSKIHNYLAWGFSVGYFFFHSWRIANDFYYLIDDRIECFNTRNLLQDIAKLVIAGSILLAMVNKDRLSQSSNLSSYFVWAIVGATCFYTAFSYIVEEMVWAYIGIIQKSIDDPGSGLDIPANITRVEDYIEELFKSKAICLRHSLWARVSFKILTIVPFSAQYFSLACFFSYMVWRNLDSEEFHDHRDLESPEPDNNSNQENNEAIQDTDDESHHSRIRLQGHNHNLQQSEDLLLSFGGVVAIIFIIYIVTIATIILFHIGMEKEYKSESIWLYHGQVSVLRLIIFIVEWRLSCWCDGQNLRPDPYPRDIFRWDVTLLILPLIPLGILYTLRAAPELMFLLGIPKESLISIFLNVFLALLNWGLAASQSFFIAQLFCRLHYSLQLKRVKYIILLLGVLNLGLWFCWILECRLVTIYLSSTRIYGVVTWIIMAYCTIPFIQFGIAHSATCFFEIYGITNVRDG